METEESVDLREYLFREEMSIAEFSTIVDCNPAYIGLIKRKVRKPGRKLARHIELATKGAVKADYLLRRTKYKS